MEASPCHLLQGRRGRAAYLYQVSILLPPSPLQWLPLTLTLLNLHLLFFLTRRAARFILHRCLLSAFLEDPALGPWWVPPLKG